MWIVECRDPSHQAFKLGLAAVILLALAHIVATLLGGCTCMCSKEEFNEASANKQLAVASLFFSWYVLSKRTKPTHCTNSKLDSDIHILLF